MRLAHSLLLIVVVSALVLAAPARAERTQVFSIQGADCGDCGTEILVTLKKLKGVKKATFDRYKVEVTASLSDAISNSQVAEWIQKSNAEFSVIPGPGKGAYLPMAEYPVGSDVQVLTRDGSALGPLEKLRVPERYTVFDVYADWCGPCRVLDGQLRDLLIAREDLAIRRLNVVRFDSPLAREFGSRLKVLPYAVVFTPTGQRFDIMGLDPKRLASALAAK